jgi:HD-GYP domain-containing protein (c-di-GMP phosphodiesterase class II)
MIIAASVLACGIVFYVSKVRGEVTDNFVETVEYEINFYFNDQKKDLEIFLRDYTIWDDLYNAIENEDYKWASDNATKFLFEEESYGYDVIYVKGYNNDYEEYYSDINKDKILELDYYKDWKKNKLLEPTYVNIEGEIYILGINEIYDSNEETKNGYYLMGKKLDKSELDGLRHFEKDTKYTMHFKHDIKDYKDEVIKTLELEIKMDSYFNELNILEKRIIYIMYLTVGMVVIIVSIFTKFVEKAINKVVKGIKDISNGNYKSKVEKCSMREFNSIIKSVNNLGTTVDNKIKEIEDTNMEMVRVLIKAIESKDEYTKGHSQRVSMYAKKIAEICGYKNLRIIENAAMLHDIGKIGLDDTILNKTGILSLGEFETVKLHPERGYYILDDCNSFDIIKEIVLQHHERFDGTGYPNKLSGEQILVEARIVTVADVFDAMTSKRSYNAIISFDAAIEELRLNAGKTFDPMIVEMILQNKDEFKKVYEKAKKELLLQEI